MSRAAVLLFILFTWCTEGSSQQPGATWMLGYPSGSIPVDTFGNLEVDFSNYPPEFENVFNKMDLYLTHAAYQLPDNSGFYTNGLEILDLQHKPVTNSQGFNDIGDHELWEGFGLPLIQGVIIVPDPGDPSGFHLLHLELEVNGLVRGKALFHSYVQYDGSEFTMTEKNSLMVRDTFTRTGLCINRHANGRDWWVILPRLLSNEIYIYLVDPVGIHLHDIQAIGQRVARRYGPFQSSFSPHGSLYARNIINFEGPEDSLILEMFEFDRCKGKFSDPLRFVYDKAVSIAGGISFSKSGKYLYTASRTKLHKFDLGSNSLPGSRKTIGIYDGFEEWGLLATTFFLMAPTPDGRILMHSTNGTRYLHEIKYPDLPGDSCTFNQRGIKLQTFNGTLPQQSYYTLGPLDGSPCDTLGLDNMPVADFRHDSLGIYAFRFTDLALGMPEQYNWYIDGQLTHDDPYLDHAFPGPGRYKVCLEVINENGMDSLCRFVTVADTATSVQDPVFHSTGIRIYPNPTPGLVQIQFEGPPPLDKLEIVITDYLGRTLYRTEAFASGSIIQCDLSALQAGIYTLYIFDEGILTATGRVVLN